MNVNQRPASALALSLAIATIFPSSGMAQSDISSQANTPPATALTKDRASYGVMNTSGQVVLLEQFEEGITIFKNAIIASPRSSSNKFRETIPRYIIDLTGKKLIEKPLGEMDTPEGGMLAVKNGDLWGYIDNTGKLVIPYKFSNAHSFYKDHAVIFEKDGLAIIDRQGNIVWSGKKDQVVGTNKYGLRTIKVGQSILLTQIDKSVGFAPLGWFADDEELKAFSAYSDNYPGSKYGFVNRQGDVVIEPKFDQVSAFYKGTAMAQNGKEAFFINAKGEKTASPDSECQFNYPSFGRGIAIFQAPPEAPALHPKIRALAGKRYGAVDKDGKICIKPEYLYLSSSGDDNGLFLAVKKTIDGAGTRFGYIDKNGAVKIPFVSSWAGEFKDGLAAFSKGKLQPQYYPENEITISEVSALDKAIRLKISEAIKGVSQDRPLRIIASLLVDGGASMKLLLGPNNADSRQTISTRLANVKDLPRPKALLNWGMDFEFVVLRDGGIIAAESAADPYNQKRAELEMLDKDTNYSYRMNSLDELEQYLKHRSDLERSIGLKPGSFECCTNSLIRFYSKCGRVKEALALIKQMSTDDEFAANEMAIEVYREASMWPELALALEKQCKTLQLKKRHEGAYIYLLNLADVYYRLDKLGLADSAYQAALASVDTRIVPEDSLAKQKTRTIPQSALYRYACFLASTGRTAKSAEIRQKLNSYFEPGVAYSIIVNDSDDYRMGTYLALVKDKDSKVFDHFYVRWQNDTNAQAQLTRGLLKPDGTELTGAHFQVFLDDPSRFSEGLAVAKDALTGRYGYIDTSGNWTIPAKFYVATPFKNGKAFAKPAVSLLPIDSTGTQINFSVIDKKGNVIAATKFNTIDNQGDGVNIVSDGAGDSLLKLNWFVNDDGKILHKERVQYQGAPSSKSAINHQFIVTGWKSEGCSTSAKGFMQDFQYTRDESTCMVEAVQRRGLHSFEETIDGQVLIGYKNTADEIVIPARYRSGSIFIDGLAAVTDTSGKQFFIKPEGSNAFNETYEQAQDFAGKAAPVSKNGKTYLIDHNGKKISEDYRWISSLSPGFFHVVDDNNNQGLLNEEGKLLIKPQVVRLRAPSEGLVAFSKNGKWGFMDLAGKEIIAPKYITVDNFHEGTAFFKR
ncbi:hypothetical protein BH11CYA1_BH11CYA1_16600 [soil metagenome]